jgi:hypothetical protein
MNSFFEHHKDSIRWHYRCFDRILLEAYPVDSGLSRCSMLWRARADPSSRPRQLLLNGLIQPFQQPERERIANYT